jgi:hypothetical protein
MIRPANPNGTKNRFDGFKESRVFTFSSFLHHDQDSRSFYSGSLAQPTQLDFSI